MYVNMEYGSQALHIVSVYSRTVLFRYTLTQALKGICLSIFCNSSIRKVSPDLAYQIHSLLLFLACFSQMMMESFFLIVKPHLAPSTKCHPHSLGYLHIDNRKTRKFIFLTMQENRMVTIILLLLGEQWLDELIEPLRGSGDRSIAKRRPP